MSKKVCRRCKQSKDLSTDYFPHNNASKDKFDSMCKECWKLRSKERSRSKKSPAPKNKKVASVGIPLQASKNSNVQKAEPKAPKHKAVWISAKKQEVVPNYMDPVPLETLADLPECVEFLASDGNLAALIEEYIRIYERRPTTLYIYPRVRFPDKFFLPITQDLIDYKENKMYAKDIKVGMKVVPVIKTLDGPLSKSKEWTAVLDDTRKKEKFLWVIKINEKPGQKQTFVCAATKEAKTGDTFNTIDLRAFPWLGWECRQPGAVKVSKAAKDLAKKTVKEAKKPGKPAKKPTTKKAPTKNPSKKIVAKKPVEAQISVEEATEFDRVFGKEE